MPILRKTSFSGYQHICQIAADRGALFYSTADFLVFFTIFSIKAAKAKISVLAFCIMLNHFHLGAYFHDVRQMESFMNGLTSSHARIYNRHYGRTGQVYKTPYKNSPKSSDKLIRCNLAYTGNNPVEKSAVSKAEDYRWNFIKYMESDHPFSRPFDPVSASGSMLTLMKKVSRMYENGQFIDYSFFDKQYESLSEDEKNQITDFIISKYNIIDKKRIMSKFGSYDTLIRFMSSMVGNEFDLADDSSKEDYRHYSQMLDIAGREGFDIRKCWTEDQPIPEWLVRKFRREAGASDYEIRKFTHGSFGPYKHSCKSCTRKTG